MGEIAKMVGKRIRMYRKKRGFSQEKLSELAGCHPTYIGQLERGEKNATLESISVIAAALQVPLSGLFEDCGGTEENPHKVLPECYDLLAKRSREEQKQLYRILCEIVGYPDGDRH